jgi:DNA mismatch repair protein MutS
VAEVLATLDGASPLPLDPCLVVVALLDRAVADTEGEARICAGFAPDLDSAVAAARGTRDWLAALEGRERERTGIRSLKVGYNKVFGYYIEVTRPNLGLVPADYARKQTVANGERFVTVPLKEAETRILAADDEIAALEREALARLSGQVMAAAPRLMSTARTLAELDAFLALAEVAARRGWTAPVLEESETLEIVGGRHPVVEAHLAGEPFIPNDCLLGGDGPRQVIVTGPNMGGKSTWLRQTALIVLLAQVGSWVPAARARIGLVDRIFSRVGAQDDLARGQSTFMTEMVETAAILRQATARSFVILDEVGRGTATADGLAIARAVLEDISMRIGARTLFATHYLELTAAANELPGVANVHVGALEQAGRVIFLYSVRPGPADQSYGIQVARLAGLPPWVAIRAEQLLHQGPRHLANGGEDRAGPGAAPAEISVAECGPVWQAGLPGVCPPSAAERLSIALRDLDLDALSPREALTWLWSEQERLARQPGET